MKYTRTVAPTTTPLLLADARDWLAMETGITADDDVITELLDEVTAYVEQRWNGRKLISQTWTITLDEEEVDDVIPIRLLPLQSVSSIKTYDDAGDPTTVNATNYFVDTGNIPRVILTSSGSYPSDMRWYSGMVITCVVGYGDASTDMPDDIAMLMKGLTLHQYLAKGRGVAQTVSGQLISIPNIYENQIKNLRIDPWR